MVSMNVKNCGIIPGKIMYYIKKSLKIVVSAIATCIQGNA